MKELLKNVEKCISDDEVLQKISTKIQITIDSCPNTISFEDAKKQVESSLKKIK